jgi:hypothetical protein
MNASIETQSGIKVLNNYPVDSKYYNNSKLPYSSVSEVMSQILQTLRYQGLTVNINGIEYWWNTNDVSINPVIKSTVQIQSDWLESDSTQYDFIKNKPSSVKGDTGATGPQGLQGVEGPKGDAGDTGNDGPQGEQGVQGTQGIQGETGEQGIQGNDGSQGIQGIAGSAGLGFKIAKTYTTVALLLADITPTGITSGEFAIVTTVDPEDSDNGRLYLWNGTSYEYKVDMSLQPIQGEIGLTGAQGVKGDKGDQGVTGNTGSTGTQGIEGPQGIKGDKGDTGTQGIRGYQGIPGIQGIQGITGSTGPKGDKGDTGDTGSTGPKGDSGEDGGVVDQVQSDWNVTNDTLPEFIKNKPTIFEGTDEIYIGPNQPTDDMYNTWIQTDVTDLDILYSQLLLGGIGFVKMNGSVISYDNSTYIPVIGNTHDINLGTHDLVVDTNTISVDSTNHRVGFGIVNPTAILHLKAGGSTSHSAPIKFTTGYLLDSEEAGTMEYDGNHLYFTINNHDGNTRYQLDQQGGENGTVTSVSALSIGIIGNDISSTVSNSTTDPVITLNIPTASSTNRGALSYNDWITFNNKLSSLDGALLVTGGTIGATNGIQVFTNTLRINALTARKIVFTDIAQRLTTTGIGTSSQFLKADGSLDSNVYVTTSSVPLKSTSIPLVDGTAVIGTSNKWADGLHVHPTDTSRQATINLTTTGTSGPATISGSNLNIPNYTGESIISTVDYVGTITNLYGLDQLSISISRHLTIGTLNILRVEGSFSFTVESGVECSFRLGIPTTFNADSRGIEVSVTAVCGTTLNAFSWQRSSTYVDVVLTSDGMYNCGVFNIMCTSF